MDDRGFLVTEQLPSSALGLDRLGIREGFDVMQAADGTVAAAVATAREDICRAVELVVSAFRRGGRLVYVGAGTSGRLGVLDATECPPTFLTDPSMVQGIIAGGADALVRSVEGAEDRIEDGASAIDERNVGPDDVVFGIATGGTTPFVHGALGRARARGARTVFLACVPKEQVSDSADVSIRVVTGPEVIAGSTRLKAGTATKMVLNRVTTLAMVQLGKVYGPLMVDVSTRANAKLVDRGIRIVQKVTGLDRSAAAALLDEADGHVKVAMVMHARQVSGGKARELLDEAEGHIGRILGAANVSKCVGVDRLPAAGVEHF